MSPEVPSDAPPDNGGILLSVREVAVKLQASRDTVERLIQQGALRAYDVSPRRRAGTRPSWRIANADIARFLDSRTNVVVPAPAPRRRARSNAVEFIQ